MYYLILYKQKQNCTVYEEHSLEPNIILCSNAFLIQVQQSFFVYLLYTAQEFLLKTQLNEWSQMNC